MSVALRESEAVREAFCVTSKNGSPGCFAKSFPCQEGTKDLSCGSKVVIPFRGSKAFPNSELNREPPHFWMDARKENGDPARFFLGFPLKTARSIGYPWFDQIPVPLYQGVSIEAIFALPPSSGNASRASRPSADSNTRGTST